MANKAPEKLTFSTTKIANAADKILMEDGHHWEIDELHLVPKDGNFENKVVCKYVLQNGKWVLVCTKT